MSAQEEIEELEERIAELRREARRERDWMIGATFHSLSAMLSNKQKHGYGEALRMSQRLSKLPVGSRANGNYREIRRKIFGMMVKLDLIDPKTFMFKFERDED